jgi:hypothetical protein
MKWQQPEQSGGMNPLKTGQLNEKHKYFTGKNKLGIIN